MAEGSSSRRPLMALVGALAMVGVGVLAYRASQTELGTIVECRSCGAKGQPLEHGWVNVLAGDAWAVQLGAHGGAVVRGPARFEAAGGGRIALSAGTVFVATGEGGRVITLLHQDLPAGIEGASVGTAGAAQLGIVSTPDGSRVEQRAGNAVIAATTGEKKLAAGQSWQTGKPPALPPPDADEARWLEQLSK